MSLDLGVMNAAVTLDDDDYNKKLRALEGKSESTFRKIGIAAAAYLSMRGMFSFAKDAIKEFSDLEEAGNKFANVYKNIESRSKATAAALQRDFGLSAQSAKEMLSGTGDLLTGFGFDQKSALDFSNMTSRLAVDLASYQNYAGGARGASEALTKGILGETESLKALGIVIQKDSEEYKLLVKSFQAASGISKADFTKIFGAGGSEEYQKAIEQFREINSLTEQQANAAAVLAIAHRQSLNAIGDYNRPGETYAQTQMNITENTRKAMAAVGEFWINGVHPATKGYNILLKSFADSDPIIQHLTMNMGVLGAGLLLLQTNTARTVNAKIADAGASILASNSTNIFTASVTRSVAALRALLASLGPIGWALLAFTGITAINNLIKSSSESASAAAEKSSQKAREASENNEEFTRKQVTAMERVKQLASYEQLNNNEREEAKHLLSELKIAYDQNGQSVDQMVSKMGEEKRSLFELLDLRKENIKQLRIMTLEAEIAEKQQQAKLNQKKPLQENGLLGDMWLTTKTLFTAPFSGFSNTFMTSIEDEQKQIGVANDKIYAEINQKMAELRALKSGADLPGTDANGNQGSNAQRKALNDLNDARKQALFDTADAQNKFDMLTSELAAKRQKLFNSAGNKPESEYTAEQLAIAKEIVEIDAKRAELLRDGSKAIKEENRDYAEQARQLKIERDQKEIDRKLSKLDQSGDDTGYSKLLNQQLTNAKKAAEDMRKEYLAAYNSAAEDELLTADEKEKLADLRKRLEEAERNVSKYSGMELDRQAQNDRRQSTSVGSFSASILNRLAGPNNAAERTASATEKTARNTDKLINKESGGPKSGD